jgi:hypothetical protein
MVIYIDEQPVPISGRLYSRAMRVPAGNHIIEFKFHPEKLFLGEKLTGMFTAFVLMVIGTGYLEWRK